jgi:WD40 repeat protein
VLDVEGDERSRQIECPDGPAPVRSVSFAANPEVVVAGVGQFVQSHSFSSGRYERLQTLKGQAAAVAVSTCGKYLAVGEDRGEGQSGRVWLHEIGESPAPSNVTHTREIEFPYTTSVCVVAFSPDSQQLVTGNEYGSLIVYDVRQALPVRMLGMPQPQRLGHYGSCAVFRRIVRGWPPPATAESSCGTRSPGRSACLSPCIKARSRTSSFPPTAAG